MSFFDDLSRSLEKAGKETLQKGKDMTETMRLNSQISEAEKGIKNCCQEIGEIYLSLHRDDYEEDYSEVMEKIQSFESQITSCKKRLDELQKMEGNRCAKCGAVLPEGAKFCGSCGAPVEDKQEVSDEPAKLCPACGAKLEENASFCVECGHKL